MAIKITVGPSVEPVTLDEAKAQCRVDLSDDDALITALIVAAREYLEGLDWRAWMTQTVEYWLDDWPRNFVIDLPRPPVQSVTSIKYYDIHDAEFTFASTNYFVDTITEPARIGLNWNCNWPPESLRAVNAVCVTYVAGWPAQEYFPQRLKQAMLLLIGHWYENREASTVGAVNRQIELGVKDLLGLDRGFRF